jgi:hypothetical protein
MSADPARRYWRGLSCLSSPGSPLELGGNSLRRRAWQPISVQAVCLLAVAAIIAGISGCSARTVGTSAGPPSTSAGPASTSASPSSTPTAAPVTASAAPSGLALTGFGATLTQWRSAHRLDRSVPAGNAYLPRLDGEDTWQLVTAAGGRVVSYTLNVAPSSLRAAETRARQEMPAGTRVLWTRTVSGDCSQEQFESAALATAVGDGQVNVEFDNASSGRAAPVTEELFSTWDAQTVTHAPAC